MFQLSSWSCICAPLIIKCYFLYKMSTIYAWARPIVLCCICFVCNAWCLLLILFIATNHRVAAAKRQQRELVAVTIRGSVLFYSSAIWTSDFRSVKREFRYLYGVDLDISKTLFYRWKMYIDHFWQWKNTKNKLGSLGCRFCWYSSYILTTRLFTNRKTP